MSSNIRFEYNGQIRDIALFPNIPPEELKTILKTLFGLEADIAGFVGKVNAIFDCILSLQGFFFIHINFVLTCF